MNESDLQRVVDQADIINILNRFVLSIDKHEWDTMRDCLTNEVDFDYWTETERGLPQFEFANSQ